MVRRYKIRPDQYRELPGNRALPEVSDDAMARGLLRLIPALQLMGGSVSIVCERYETELPGEMVTTGVVVQWSDRTDADPKKGTERRVQMTPMEPLELDPQPAYEPPTREELEALAATLDEPLSEEEEQEEGEDAELAVYREELRQQITAAAAQADARDEVGDGLVPRLDEDTSAIPAGQR